jgi:hypothetical protein
MHKKMYYSDIVNMSYEYLSFYLYNTSQNRVRERDICIHKAIAQA